MNNVQLKSQSMNRIFRTLSMVALSFCMTGCWTSIRTVAPTAEVVVPVKTVYTTTVTTPAPKVVTHTTVTVTNFNTDWSFYLDLNAVAAAFAESRSIREFEQLLNSSRYMINNLDLNGDGWVDYLRVIETRNGHYHAMLIQACLAPGVFQDVATLVAERRADVLYVEVIGDRYLYGYNYIVRPVFVKRPPIWGTFGNASYTVWFSPYYYDYYPSYYTRPKPIYLNHYQAYVNTYMTNHHYCHRCDYPSSPFYNGYTQMTQSHRRNDYQKQHPDQSFEQRVTRTIEASGTSVRNAGQLRSEVSKEATKNTGTSTSTRTSGNTGTSATTGTSARSGSTGTSARSGSTGTSARSGATTQPSTSVESRVNKSGTTRTTIKTTDDKGRTTTVKREGNTSTRSTGTSTRSSQDKQGESSPRSSQRGR